MEGKWKNKGMEIVWEERNGTEDGRRMIWNYGRVQRELIGMNE